MMLRSRYQRGRGDTELFKHSIESTSHEFGVAWCDHDAWAQGGVMLKTTSNHLVSDLINDT